VWEVPEVLFLNVNGGHGAGTQAKNTAKRKENVKVPNREASLKATRGIQGSEGANSEDWE